MIRQDFKSFFLAGQVKVAHRLPGRLRLAVPALAGLSDRYQEYTSPTEELLTKLPGLANVNISETGASVLLRYDTTVVTESDVLGWIERLALTGREKYTALKSVENVHFKLLRLQAILKDEINRIRADNADD